MSGTKHYIECHCVLPQYRSVKKPIYFGFNVFSEYDHDENIKLKYVQCPNCGVIHKVHNVCHSEILSGKDESAMIRDINDVKLSLPEKYVELFETHQCEFADYEKLEHIINNKLWSEYIVLSMKQEDDSRVGKIMRFLKTGTPRVEPYITKELIEYA
jgi:hypothetical protein